MIKQSTHTIARARALPLREHNASVRLFLVRIFPITFSHERSVSFFGNFSVFLPLPPEQQSHTTAALTTAIYYVWFYLHFDCVRVRSTRVNLNYNQSSRAHIFYLCFSCVRFLREYRFLYFIASLHSPDRSIVLHFAWLVKIIIIIMIKALYTFLDLLNAVFYDYV